MPAILIIVFVLFLASPAAAQGTPPMDPEQRLLMEKENARKQAAQAESSGPFPSSTIDSLKKMAKQQINKAIMTPAKPGLKQWAPLAPRQKFHMFLVSTYAPQTFISAGFDAARAKSFSDNAAYARGAPGFAQHYGVEVATNETDVFFQKFLFPVVLRQDPRYFRNPDSSTFKRVVYSMSRVIITGPTGGTTPSTPPWCSGPLPRRPSVTFTCLGTSRDYGPLAGGSPSIWPSTAVSTCSTNSGLTSAASSCTAKPITMVTGFPDSEQKQDCHPARPGSC